MKEQHKKESPVLSLLGMGGGGTGVALGGGLALPKTYVDDVFSTYLYEGSASAQTITNGIDLSGEGGMVWLKSRTGGYNNNLYDTERGVKKALYSNLNSAEYTENSSIGTFNSNGFAFAGGGDAAFNTASADFVSWTFRKAPGFFDVVTYTGTGSARTIAHNLGSVPGMIIVKVYAGGTDNWFVYHRSLGDQRIKLDKDDASGATAVWNNTAPTSSVFSVGTDGGVNGSGESYVAYIFAHDDAQFGTDEDESIIKCGSYTGNGSTDGPEINLGFEPQWVMIKASTGTGHWLMADNMRVVATGGYDAYLKANDNSSEFDSYSWIDFTSTGFKLTNNGGSLNGSGTYIYMVIRRPNKPPEAATDVFAIDTKSSGRPNYTSNFPVDLVFNRNNINSSDSTSVETRLTSKQLITNSTAAEGFDMSDTFRCNTGWEDGSSVDTTDYAWMFKRAPGFMDVVAYTGNASTNNITHNLQVVPELMMFKNRDQNIGWPVWFGDGANVVPLQGTNAKYDEGLNLNGTTATNIPISSGNSSYNNNGINYIAYLFASRSGISKVGTYSGNTGYAVNVPCGFTNGARFILIKRTDSTGDWYYWDSVRGIVSGNDPYLLLNAVTGEVTNTDYVDPLTSGFTVTASAPSSLNVSGGTYLFLAIA